MTIRSHMTAIWQYHMAYSNMTYCVLLESLIQLAQRAETETNMK
jgi:hypothetical protein